MLVDRTLSECLTVCDPTEPLEGNYFVSAYPPFCYWQLSAIKESQRSLLACPQPRR
jgi:hypothetical protein